MSYSICKGIAKKGENIEVNVASSNVFPKHWYKSDYKGRNYEEQLFWLYTDIEDGNIHLNNSLYKYNYAFLKAREFMKENNINGYYDLFEKKYDYYYEKIKELIGIDLKSDYWKDEELKNTYNNFQKNNGELIDNIKFESAYRVYGKVFEVFKKALEEKEDNTLYTLYCEDYKSFIKCGRNGKFWYGYTSAKEKGKYKEMYCKMKEIDRCGVVIKRLVLTDNEIKKELENQELEKQAKEKIKNLEQVKEDLEKFKKGQINIDKYYLKELCKLYNIKERFNDRRINIPKKLNYLMINGYNFYGNCNYQTSNKISYIRNELLKRVEN